MVKAVMADKKTMVVNEASAEYSLSSMDLCPHGYKQTEVGVIPEDWDVGCANDLISKMTSGLSRRLASQDIGIPVLISGNIQNNQLTTEDLKYWYLKDPQGANTEDYVLNDGDILLCFINSMAQIGKPCIYRDVGRPVIYTTNLFRIVILNSHVPEFAFFLFCSAAFQKEIQLISKIAVNQASFTKPDFLKIRIPLPSSKEEQKSIAKALSDVDELIVSLENLIAKKRDIKTATMQQLLTGKKRLPGFGQGKGYKQTELGEIPEDWDVEPLGHLLKIRHGKSQKEVLDPYGEYPILATGGEIGRAREPLYSKPSVFIGRKGTIDIPYYMDTPFWSVDTLFYSEISDLADPKFLYYKFLFIDWYQYNEASGVPSLNAATIEKITQAVPSTREEQKAISNILMGFDREIKSLESRLVKTKAINQGMMQELLTGRTRLVSSNSGVSECLLK